MKHLVFNTAKHGWNVVVSNHRGLGGVSVTVSPYDLFCSSDTMHLHLVEAQCFNGVYHFFLEKVLCSEHVTTCFTSTELLGFIFT